MQQSLQQYIKCVSALLVLLLLYSSCSVTKKVPEGKYLLSKNKLDFSSNVNVTRKGEIIDGLTSLMIQKPNSKVLGMPVKLHFYNNNAQNRYTDTGFTRPKNRVAEKPILYDSTLSKQTAINMQNYLFNRGYFYAKAKDTVLYRGKKARVIYKVVSGTNYLIRKVNLDVDDSVIYEIVANSMKETLLKNGAEFSTQLAQEERARINDVVRNKGYYRFNQNNIVTIQVDTLHSDTVAENLNIFERTINTAALNAGRFRPTLDATIYIRKNDEPKAYDIYTYQRVSVYPDFVDRSDATNPDMLRSKLDNINFSFHKNYIKTKTLSQQIFISPNDTFSQANYDLTINKLNNLGLFSYVRLAITEDSVENKLNGILLLNPADKYEISTNLELSTSGQNYTTNTNDLNFGSNLSVGIRDKNWLRSGNQLFIQGYGGVELGYGAQVGTSFFNDFYLISRTLGVNSSLTFPRFLSPFFRNRFAKSNQPSTVISLGASMLDRIVFFRIVSVNGSYMYSWRTHKNHQFEYAPLMTNIFLMPAHRMTDSFRAIIKGNELLSNIYRETFILGQSFNYIYSNQETNPGQNYTYLRLGLEESGLYLTAVDAMNKNRFPINYAQYVKFDADLRRYLRWKNSMAVFRFILGLGLPYGQNVALPYIKQYFSGGPYSIRGWRARQLGPGGSAIPQAVNGSILDRTGDIKLEGNVEYRFDMIQMFSGALKINGATFIDAGNIWLAKKSNDLPNGEFRFDKLYDQLAISYGVGLRVDVGGFFLLRTDWGFPLKKPYIESNDGWVIKDINFGSPVWRRNEPVFQFAIGYPF